MQWTSFDFEKLLEGQRAASEPWLEFLRVPSLRAGLYVLAPGAWDHQTPHQEDEVYYVVSGRATFEAGQDRREAIPGALIYVAARQEHRFTDIVEELRLLVFFSTSACIDSPRWSADDRLLVERRCGQIERGVRNRHP